MEKIEEMAAAIMRFQGKGVIDPNTLPQGSEEKKRCEGAQELSEAIAANHIAANHPTTAAAASGTDHAVHATTQSSMISSVEKDLLQTCGSGVIDCSRLAAAFHGHGDPTEAFMRGVDSQALPAELLL